MRYDAIKRLETTIANLQVQNNQVMFDDYEKLEEVLGWLKQAQPVVNAILDNPKLQKQLEEA
jgi:short-subunit dehydrogenase involved in D-alanine esterification of teichoic acids